jgi:UDP-glucose 4-epimerase
MNILVTGGAGYIGSVMTRLLCDLSYSVVVLDSLEYGWQTVVDKRAIFIKGNIQDKETVTQIIHDYHIDAVIHFAGVISMEESVKNPIKYFEENTVSTLSFLKLLIDHHVNHFIFSSTAGVYGNPEQIPISEDHPLCPVNPYGESKLMIEKMLKTFGNSYSLRYAILRYFNAAGASLDGNLGERHKDETHIIPLAVNAVLTGRPFFLFGADYQTKDGTCVRDYIHVEDLCTAHVKALEYITQKKESIIANVGTGRGVSNKEVLDMVERISGKKLSIQLREKRAGDAAELVADSSFIKSVLGWEPKMSDITTIVESAWKFHLKIR